jgi:anaerobic magnesium-protoporphyrin IX monomethyl ester cyclase
MKFALVNPNWDFAGSTYFGCKEPHIPLELMFAAGHLRSRGHDALVVDAHLDKLSLEQAKRKVDFFQPDFLVIPTAPTYLFWRCPPPELRVPIAWIQGMSAEAVKVIVGPHASATPAAAIRKTGCAVAVRGEPDQVLADLAVKPWKEITGCCFRTDDTLHINPSLASADMKALSALDFQGYRVEAHRHRHHVFTADQGIGAEL